MSPPRRECFASLKNTGCNVHLITPDNLEEWVLPEHPLHAGYKYLTPIHRSDYLRAYFMHHHGGAYSDIKWTAESWTGAIKKLADSDFLGLGYPEVPNGMASMMRSKIGEQYYLLDRPSSFFRNRLEDKRMMFFRNVIIGNCAFVFKKRTIFTQDWLDVVNRRMDFLMPHLVQHPGIYPKERSGVDYQDGRGASRYPVRWSFLMGHVLPILACRYRAKILRSLPSPRFDGYE